ncbi:Protein kinase domain [Macleaya cordata]|uniref:Protein kinase domain n=1 Tax=Macleaya cordata TaxID=56857 RepID=A0A200PWZ9_MACCD|nr:Protein kinase domain [Macleaya cordata]
MEKKSFQQSRPLLGWVRGNCIGKGSFGTVNLAVDKSNGHIFAVKSVNLKTAHPFHIQSLENEIRILQSLSSPYVIQYLNDDLEFQSGTAVYQNLHMEYMAGGTVVDLAAKFGGKGIHGYVDHEQIVRSYTRCIVSALHYIHSSGFVHCDVKGKNVLVGSTPGFAKLADFGSAKRISSDGCANLEDGGAKMMILPRGTPLWMAPEVIRQERQGPESDVWSLGCTIIEMITGNPPWKDCGPKMVHQIGFSDQVPEFPDQISELGRDFLEKCLRRDPSERWTCEELLRHQFLSTDSEIVNNQSPRCVLDWSNSEFRDDNEDEEDFQLSFINSCSLNSSSDSENLVISSAKDRISKLASVRGVVWESDGWELVRSGFVCDRAGDSFGSEGIEWTNSEFSNLISTPEEEEENTLGTGSEYLNFPSAEEETEGTKLEYLNSVGSTSFPSCCDCKAGLGCHQHGSKKWNLAVTKIKKDYHSCYL